MFLSCILSVSPWDTYHVSGRGLPPFPLIGLLPSPLAGRIIGHATPTLVYQSESLSIPSALNARLISVWSLYGPVFDQWIKENIQSCLSKCIWSLKFFFYTLATRDISARWLCPVYSFKHLLPPERPEIQRATSPSTVCWGRYNSSWGNPTGIIHEGFHIKIFCRAPELNNSCLVSIFIGGGSAGVIRHGRSLGITSTQCGCWLSRFTEVGQEGGNKRKRRVALSLWRLGPPISGKEPAWRRDRVELLTFGEGPLGLDWVMVSAASVKHLY